MTYTQWCIENKCTHGHCPDGCEHPQPISLDTKLVCGRCWIVFSDVVEIVPCLGKDCVREETTRV